jgi:hypothetical protein
MAAFLAIYPRLLPLSLVRDFGQECESEGWWHKKWQEPLHLFDLEEALGRADFPDRVGSAQDRRMRLCLFVNYPDHKPQRRLELAMQLLPGYNTVDDSTTVEAASLAQKIITNDHLTTHTPVVERVATGSIR